MIIICTDPVLLDTINNGYAKFLSGDDILNDEDRFPDSDYSWEV